MHWQRLEDGESETNKSYVELEWKPLKQLRMKNLVIIIKNLPDEAIDESWNGGLKAFGIEGTQQATIDYKEAHAVAQLRTIEAIITLQSNYIYQEIMRMPNPKKGNMLQKIKTYAFNKLFGKFNNN